MDPCHVAARALARARTTNQADRALSRPRPCEAPESRTQLARGGRTHPAREMAFVLAIARIVGDLERHLDHAAARVPPLDDGAKRLEHVFYGLIVRRHERRESHDSLLPRARGEVTQERRAEPSALPIVRHRDRGLRLLAIRARAHVAGDPEPVAAGWVDRHERLVIVVVDIRQVGELLVRQPRRRAEEAAIARQLREALKTRREASLVAGTERANLGS